MARYAGQVEPYLREMFNFYLYFSEMSFVLSIARFVLN